MRFKQHLPVTYLLFTYRGRLSRGAYLTALLFCCAAFYVLSNLLNFAHQGAGYVMYPILFWVLINISAKRLHDQSKSGTYLFLALIPVLGPLYLIWQLWFKKGSYELNKYGIVPGTKADYHKNDEGQVIPHLKTGESIIDDVTRLNPVLVKRIERPETIEALCELVKNTKEPLSTGGGRFSMGGQTASPHTVHVDMRKLNRILELNKEEKWIRVECGTRWCDIQQYIDPHDLSIKIMQTYANFTVGGALSVNAHGRYMGQGPLVLSVRAIDLILADGTLLHASKTENTEYFYTAIGGYNAIGIIARAELDLADNIALKRVNKKMPQRDYYTYFKEHVVSEPKSVFHNGDIYPPLYKRMRAVTWVETTEKPTVKTRLMPLKDSYPLERYFLWSFTSTPLGKWRREFLIDPLVFLNKKIHWRNYEAGYDVAELEPKSRKASTYVLLEYFVPVDSFQAFADQMAEIFIRYNVNVLNVSVRHAKADPGTLLAWAREEVFAFVVYYKQKTAAFEKNKVAVWTRELADAVIKTGGSYYLPYQIHPTTEQFHKAYPQAKQLFELKQKFDPDYKFRNCLWDTYYQPFIEKKHEHSIGVQNRF